MFIFTKAILEGRPIDIYNYGNMSRDFTYIDDIVDGILNLLEVVPQRNADWQASRSGPDSSSAPYAVYNIGHGSPVSLMDFVHAIESATGRKALYNYLPMQPGDVPSTHADTEPLLRATGYHPHVDVKEGAGHFVDWYRTFYGH